MAVWILDAAYGGNDFGAISKGGVKESEFVLEAVLEAKKHLERNSEKVILIRDEDKILSNEERIDIANNTNGDYFISFHMNSSKDESKRGVKVLVVNDGAEDYRLARLIRDEIYSDLRTNNLGIVKDESKVYDNLNMIGIIVYGEYLSNKEAIKELDAKSYGMMVAKAALAFRDKVLLLSPVTEPKKTQKKYWRLCIGYYSDYDEAVKAMIREHKNGVKNAHIIPYEGQ